MASEGSCHEVLCNSMHQACTKFRDVNIENSHFSAFLGALSCFVLMFFIDATYAAVTIGVLPWIQLP